MGLLKNTDRKLGEESLQASEENFRTLAETANDAILSADSRGSVVYFNRAAERMFGYSRDEAIGQPLTLLMPERFRDAHAQGFERLLRTGEARVIGKTVEMTGLRKDGSEFPVELSLSTWRTHSGFFFSAILSDISERRKAEKALRESEEMFRLLVSGVKDYAIYMLDREGNVATWNAGAEAIKGYPAEEIIGQHFSKFYTPEDVAAGKPSEELGIAIEEGRFEDEGRRIRKNGEQFWASVLLTALYDEGGKLRGFAKVTRDITARKRTEEALRASEERFSSAFERAAMGIGLLAPDGRWLKVNRALCNLVGYSTEELLARKFQDITHPDDVAADLENVRRLLSGEIPTYQREKRYIHKSGHVLWVLLSVSVVPGDRGQERYLISQIQNITKRKEAEEALRRQRAELARSNAELTAANKELEAFSYSVSHDLRAPLRSIDGFSMALLEDYSQKLDAEGRKCLERVRSATQRMGVLIDDLLNLARVTRTEIRPQRVNFSVVGRSILSELHAQQPERRTVFRIEDGLEVTADPHLIRLALENLLGNAWKFTSKRNPGCIEFGKTNRKGTLAYFVRDNGAGFDPAHAGRLFGAFQRLHDSSEFPGTGVGLATVQRIIHRHGGTIWAEGAVEKGATFYFTLWEMGLSET